jgi:hypothetical protein
MIMFQVYVNDTLVFHGADHAMALAMFGRWSAHTDDASSIAHRGYITLRSGGVLLDWHISTTKAHDVLDFMLV